MSPIRSRPFFFTLQDHGGRAQEARSHHRRAQEGGRLRSEPAQHATIGRALIPVVDSSGLGGRHSWRSGAPDRARRARAPAAPAAEATADSEDLAAAHHRQQRGRACLCRRPAAADCGLSGRSVSTVALPVCHVTGCHVYYFHYSPSLLPTQRPHTRQSTNLSLHVSLSQHTHRSQSHTQKHRAQRHTRLSFIPSPDARRDLVRGKWHTVGTLLPLSEHHQDDERAAEGAVSALGCAPCPRW